MTSLARSLAAVAGLAATVLVTPLAVARDGGHGGSFAGAGFHGGGAAVAFHGGSGYRGGYNRSGYYGGGYYRGGYYRGGGRGYWGPGRFWGGLGLGLGVGALVYGSSYGGTYWAGYPDGYDSYYYDAAPVIVTPSPVYVPANPPVIVERTVRSGQAVPQSSRAPEPIFYPRNGQSAAALESDRRECNRWATGQAGAMADGSVFQRATYACMEGRGYTVK